MSARLRLFGLAGVVALLHALGWGLYLWYSRHTPTLGLALTGGVLPSFQQAGSTIGASISGAFLLLIGLLNLFVLADIVRMWRAMKTGRRDR